MLLVIDIGNTNTSLGVFEGETLAAHWRDRKSTRLNSSHSQISYAVFCLKKKKKNTTYFDLHSLAETEYSAYLSLSPLYVGLAAPHIGARLHVSIDAAHIRPLVVTCNNFS